MEFTVDTYLETLLAFVPKNTGKRLGCDYVSLIHVPARGPERIYSLSFDDEAPVLTLAQFRETVWEVLQGRESGSAQMRPNIDAIQAQVPHDHPIFDFIDGDTLRSCGNYSDGQAGLDYYLMVWQKDGEANVVECWEPYGRGSQAWLTVIGALQALSSQYERMVLEHA